MNSVKIDCKFRMNHTWRLWRAACNARAIVLFRQGLCVQLKSSSGFKKATFVGSRWFSQDTAAFIHYTALLFGCGCEWCDPKECPIVVFKPCVWFFFVVDVAWFQFDWFRRLL